MLVRMTSMTQKLRKHGILVEYCCVQVLVHYTNPEVLVSSQGGSESLVIAVDGRPLIFASTNLNKIPVRYKFRIHGTVTTHENPLQSVPCLQPC